MSVVKKIGIIIYDQKTLEVFLEEMKDIDFSLYTYAAIKNTPSSPPSLNLDQKRNEGAIEEVSKDN